MKVYQKLAQSIDAFHRCKKEGNAWSSRHDENIIAVVNRYLPSGSGIDAGNKFDFEKSNMERLVIHSGYHKMDENGFYDGWIEFTVTVKPSLFFGFVLSIVGNFGKEQHLKDYLYDIYGDALECENTIGNTVIR